MKKILAPTDFSATAENAVDYAAKLAESMDATLIMINCYHLPAIASGDTNLPLLTLDQLEKASNASLFKEQKRVHKKNPKLKLKIEARLGFAVDEIADYVNRNEIDLIVMGISGRKKNSELFIGSISTALIKETNCPVLVVPADAHYQSVMKIALACDLKDIVHPECFDSLKEIVTHFNAGLNVLTVVRPDEEISTDKAVNGIRLDHLLEEVDHKLHFTENEDVVEGIENFVEKNKINMISVLSRKHNFISRLLHPSNTKRMAFHTNVPLLALHE